MVNKAVYKYNPFFELYLGIIYAVAMTYTVMNKINSKYSNIPMILLLSLLDKNDSSIMSVFFMKIALLLAYVEYFY
jgi:hypothetical protein